MLPHLDVPFAAEYHYSIFMTQDFIAITSNGMVVIKRDFADMHQDLIFR